MQKKKSGLESERASPPRACGYCYLLCRLTRRQSPPLLRSLLPKVFKASTIQAGRAGLQGKAPLPPPLSLPARERRDPSSSSKGWEEEGVQPFLIKKGRLHAGKRGGGGVDGNAPSAVAETYCPATPSWALD